MPTTCTGVLASIVISPIVSIWLIACRPLAYPRARAALSVRTTLSVSFLLSNSRPATGARPITSKKLALTSNTSS